MNFTQPKLVGQDIKKGTVTPQGGFDNAFVLEPHQPNDSIVTVFAPLTGLHLEMSTTQISVQFYSGNFLDNTLPRKDDQIFGNDPQYYAQYSTLVFEAQHFPDSVHHPSWPTTILKGNERYTQRTTYRLFV